MTEHSLIEGGVVDTAFVSFGYRVAIVKPPAAAVEQSLAVQGHQGKVVDQKCLSIEGVAANLSVHLTVWS